MKQLIIYITLVMCSLQLAAQSTVLSTKDSLLVYYVYTEDRTKLSALQPDGSSNVLIVRLDGDNDQTTRRYTAFNTDVTLPFGIEVVKTDGVYQADFPLSYNTLYGNTTDKNVSRLMVDTVFNVNTLRIASYSTENKAFSRATGNLFEVKLRINTPYVKPGDNPILFSGTNLTVAADAQKYVPGDSWQKIKVGDGPVSVSMNILANRYTSYVLPFDTAIPDGVQAFACEGIEGDTLYLSAVTRLQAYRPYIFLSTEGFEGTVSGNLTAANYQSRVQEGGYVVSGPLYGAITPQTIRDGYVLQSAEQENQMFYNVEGQTYYIPSGKCWLQTQNCGKTVYISLDDSATPIASPMEEKVGNDTYDLSGRRLGNDSHQKGVLIVNRKKVLQ